MDENELVKSGMEVVLRPLTDITENVLGRLGGDWLSEIRARNRAKLREETKKIMNARNTKIESDPSPSVVTPLLSAAQDESRDELIKMWAALTATALDPKCAGIYRREFVEIAKKLEPIDVRVLPILANSGAMAPSRLEFISTNLRAPRDQVELAFRNLKQLELVAYDAMADAKAHPYVQPLGRQFLAAVQPT